MTSSTEWQPINKLQKETGEVLLLWAYPEQNVFIQRIGRLFIRMNRGFEDVIIVRLELDLGDFSAVGYSSGDMDQPTHWMPLPPPPIPTVER